MNVLHPFEGAGGSMTDIEHQRLLERRVGIPDFDRHEP
jgi:hypothetical protein